MARRRIQILYRRKNVATILVLGIVTIAFVLSNSGNDEEGFRAPNLTKYQHKPVFAIAIFSRETSMDKRKSTRETWLSQIHTTPFDIKYKFVLDRPTIDTEKERLIYGDIIYTNMSSKLSGYANCFSTRMLTWFQYVLVNFPTADLIAKMDDDVYLCVPRNFQRIFNVMTRRLYYGWKHGSYNRIYNLTRVDEMFVVVGRELVDRITKRKYCGCFENASLSADCNKRKSNSELISHRYGDIALSIWLSPYNDVDRVSDNSYIRHYSYEFIDRMKNHKFAVPQFCLKNVIFHKSSNYIKYKLHHYNMYFRAKNRISLKSKFCRNILRDVPFIPRFIPRLGKPFNPNEALCEYWVVTRAPKTFNKQMSTVLASFASMDWCVIIIGDQFSESLETFQKSIDNADNKTVFLRPEDHEVYFPPMSDALLWNHVGRRNIGYAYAMHHGAKFIFDYYLDDKMVSCVTNTLPNIKDKLTADTHITNCRSIIWSCTTFTFMALPISVNQKDAQTYRLAIVNAIKMINTNNTNDLYNQNLAINLASALTEIPEILKQQDIEDIYLHLYRRGLVEYDDLLFSRIWRMSIPKYVTCA